MGEVFVFVASSRPPGGCYHGQEREQEGVKWTWVVGLPLGAFFVLSLGPRGQAVGSRFWQW